MSKGTPSKSGGKRSHTICRRCGRHSFHISTKVCSACGFGKTKKMKNYNWAKNKK